MALLWRLKQLTSRQCRQGLSRRRCTPERVALCATDAAQQGLAASKCCPLSSMTPCAWKGLCLSGFAARHNAGTALWTPAPSPWQRVIRQAAVRCRLRSGQQGALCCNGRPASTCLAAGRRCGHSQQRLPGASCANRAQTVLSAERSAWAQLWRLGQRPQPLAQKEALLHVRACDALCLQARPCRDMQHTDTAVLSSMVGVQR